MIRTRFVSVCGLGNGGTNSYRERNLIKTDYEKEQDTKNRNS